MITDLSVLQSREEIFSFDRMLHSLDRLHAGAEFERAWLAEWGRDSYNGFALRPRPSSELRQSHYGFQLLGFTYRPDLSTAHAPEGRFHAEYGLYDFRLGVTLGFFVIFEFDLPPSVKWAHEFHALGDLEWGPEYEARLRAIVARVQADSPSAVVRTNDFFLAFDWELREFSVGADGLLRLQSPEQTPADEFQRPGPAQERLAEWLRGPVDAAGVAGEGRLPPAFQGGAVAIPAESFRWRVPGVPEATVRAFSAQTCNGCHSGETGTRFTHFSNRQPGAAPQVSAFLRGDVAERAAWLQHRLDGEKIPIRPRGSRPH